MADPSRLDPDAFIREHVFQRIVNTTGIDPKPAAQGALRLHVIMLATCVLTVLSWCIPLMLARNQPILLPIMLSILMVANMVVPCSALRESPAWSLRPMAAVQRILILGFVVLLSAMTIMTMDLDLPVVVRMGIIGMTIGWAMGLAAIYLHLCLPAPPRTPRTSTSRIRQTA